MSVLCFQEEEELKNVLIGILVQMVIILLFCQEFEKVYLRSVKILIHLGASIVYCACKLLLSWQQMFQDRESMDAKTIFI